MIELATLIFWAGIGQLCLVIASTLIPRALKWRQDVAKLRPLTRQVFWTYAAYIWSTNLFFGVVSVALPGELAGGGAIAAALTGFISLYWGARVAIQFVYFDRSDAPHGVQYTVAEAILVGLFITLTGVYGYATWINLGTGT